MKQHQRARFKSVCESSLHTNGDGENGVTDIDIDMLFDSVTPSTILLYVRAIGLFYKI